MTAATIAIAAPVGAFLGGSNQFAADSVYGASPNNTGLVNYAAIQAALDAANTAGGGVVSLTAPGTYTINNTLMIYSNTEFYRGQGVIVKMENSAGGKPVLQNYAFSLRASPATVTLTWSSGITAAITGWTNHGCSIGDYVWLQGATLSVYNTIGYISAANSAAGTATVYLRYVPSGAVSGTITALKCDRNITITGPGTFDYNYPSNDPGTSNLNSNCINLGCIQNLFVTGQFQNAQKYCIQSGAVADFVYDRINFPLTNSDGVKVFGPAYNGVVSNLSGENGDDVVSFHPLQAAPFTSMLWTRGDTLGMVAENIAVNSTVAGAQVALYPGPVERMTVYCKNIGGQTLNDAGVRVSSENSATDTVESLIIDGVKTYGRYGIRLGRTSSNVATVKYLRVTGVAENAESASWNALLLDTGCVIEDGEVDLEINNTAFGASTQYAAIINGTYQRLMFKGTIEGGSNARGIQLQTAQTGDLIVSVKKSAGGALVDGSQVTGTITLQNCYLTSSFGVSMSANTTANVNLIGNVFNNMSGGVLRTSGTPGTLNVRAEGNVYAGTSVLLNAVAGSAPTIYAQGTDIQRPSDYAFAAGGLAFDATTNFKTANTVTYSVNGLTKSKVATTAITPTAAAVQADGTTCIYLVMLDASGNFSTLKGTAITTGAGMASIPFPTAGKTAIGAFKVVLSGGTYTAGTTNLNAAGLTVTYADFTTIPPSMTM